jgi:hypothetical protein
MSQNLNYTDDHFTNALVSIQGFDIGGTLGENGGFPQMTIKEIVLAESLLTPGLQTSVTFQSQLYTGTYKNFDSWKNQNINFTLTKENGASLSVLQKVYRLDNRDFMPVNVGQTEEFTVHACDQTLLNDAKTLVSKSWKCTEPSSIVSYVLQSCAGATLIDVENCGPTRDYIAENIHPFQVVAQQGNVALAGDDPSFVHFMTYAPGGGQHHFRSLKSLCRQGPVATYKHGENGFDGGAGPLNSGGYQNPNVALAFMFPCDFDYLSDLLNGLDENGQNMNTVAMFNPLNLSAFQVGNSSGGCGIGGFNFKTAMSNSGTSQQMDSCNYEVEKYLLKRQARMALLERDKVALRMTVPWNPNLHAGSVINLDWRDRYGNVVYGNGTYLISSMQHIVRLGGFAVTSLDCVSTSVAGGIV